jgi:hypothetical protein
MTARPIPSSRAARVAHFLTEVHPPLPQLLIAAAMIAFLNGSAQALAGRAPISFGWREAVAALSVALVALLMRVYDELKDVETDLRLGRAGDPKYSVRPIVTGHITVADLVALRWGVFSLAIALNLLMPGWSLGVFAAQMFLCWLSFKWFFWPAISRHLMLAFVTHNPLALLVGVYALALARDQGVTVSAGWAAVLLATTWAPVAGWELSRKIRAPADETDYQTYSKVLGWKLAVWLPVVCVAVSTAGALALASQLGLGWSYRGAVLIAAAVATGSCLRFRISPSARTANLRPLIELHFVVTVAGLPIALAVAHGIRWI